MHGRNAHFFFKCSVKGLAVAVTTHLPYRLQFLKKILLIAQQLYGFLHTIPINQRSVILSQPCINDMGETALVSTNQSGEFLYGKVWIQIYFFLLKTLP